MQKINLEAAQELSECGTKACSCQKASPRLSERDGAINSVTGPLLTREGGKAHTLNHHRFDQIFLELEKFKRSLSRLRLSCPTAEQAPVAVKRHPREAWSGTVPLMCHWVFVTKQSWESSHSEPS